MTVETEAPRKVILFNSGACEEVESGTVVTDNGRGWGVGDGSGRGPK